MAESINLIPDQMKLAVKYNDFIHPVAEDNRSGDEIAFEVIQHLGLRTQDERI